MRAVENSSPWLTVREAAERARCGPRVIYREVEAGRLRAARLGGRRELRLLPEWVDDWLIATTTPIEVDRSATSSAVRQRNFGLRKICSCGRRRWSRCTHSWYFNYKPKGGAHHRFSLDVEF